MTDGYWFVSRWGGLIAWSVGGLVLLACYRRHPRSVRRGLAAVAVRLGLVEPLHYWWYNLRSPGPGQLRLTMDSVLLYVSLTSVLDAACVLLLAWAALTDRPPPAADD